MYQKIIILSTLVCRIFFIMIGYFEQSMFQWMEWSTLCYNYYIITYFNLFSHFDGFLPMICERTDARLTSSLWRIFPPCFKVAESFENVDNILRSWAIDKVQKKSWWGIEQVRELGRWKIQPFLLEKGSENVSFPPVTWEGLFQRVRKLFTSG